MTESSRHAARSVIGAGPFWPSFDEIAANGVDGQIIIQAPPSDGACIVPFVVGDVLNLYEWSMVLGDLHPGSPLGAVGTAEEGHGDLRVNTIDLFNRPRAIFKALMAAYDSGMKPMLAWDEEPPDDETLLRFRRDDILKVISAIGADGIVIRILMAERERQGSSEVARAESGISAAAGSKTVIHETAKPKMVTQRKGGRKPGSGAIDDRSALLNVLHLLAVGKASSVWDAAAAFANGNVSTQRRLHRKFRCKWGTSPPPGKTWKDIEQGLNAN